MTQRLGHTPRAVIEGLQAALREKQDELESLLERNYVLRLRWSALALSQRCLEEVAAHKRRHGGDAGAEEAQLEALRAAARARGRGAPLGLPLPHLAPGVSITGLDSATAAEVAEARAMDYAAAAAKLSSLLAGGRRLLDELYAPPGPGAPSAADAAASAAPEARQELAAVGTAMRRFYFLVLAWIPQLYFHLSGRHHQTGSDLCGVPGPPCHVWDTAVSRAGYCREQALLLLENCRMRTGRLAKLHAQRAAIAAELSNRSSSVGAAGAGSSAPPPVGAPFMVRGPAAPGARPATAPGTPPGPSGRLPLARGGGGGGGSEGVVVVGGGGSNDSGGSDDSGRGGYAELTTEELVECLAVNSACERDVILVHGVVNAAAMTDEQTGQMFCTAYPHPVDVPAVVESFRHLLVADGGAALPWAGPRWGGARR